MDDYYDIIDLVMDEEDTLDFETFLYNNNTTADDAFKEAGIMLQRFSLCAERAGINLSQKKPLIWFDLIKKCKEYSIEPYMDMFLMMISDCGLFFSEPKDELLIRAYLATENLYKKIKQLLTEYKQKGYEFTLLREKSFMLNHPVYTCDDTDYLTVFDMICREGYAEQCLDKAILADNLCTVNALIQSDVDIKKVAPLVYFQVYVHNRKKLFEKVGYTVNPRNLFRKENYSIKLDNGKNFDQYAQYCSLYIDLKDCLYNVDSGLCDAGFLACSNLAQWCFENVEQPYAIPLTPAAIVDYCSVSIFESPVDDITFWRNSGITAEQLYKWEDKHITITEKAEKAATAVNFDDINAYIKDSDKYITELFERARLSSVIHSEHLEMLRAVLANKIQQRFEWLLEEELTELITKINK